MSLGASRYAFRGLLQLCRAAAPLSNAAATFNGQCLQGSLTSSTGASGITSTFGHSASFSTSDTGPARGYYGPIVYPTPSAKVGEVAPSWSAGAVVDGEIKQISSSDFKGKYTCLFFYPKDFTFVCPTEIIAFSDRAKEFEALDCQVIAASTDTEESHLAWIRTPRNRGGLGYMQIPIVADVTKEISAKYGVLLEKIGIALRGLFLIDPKGVIRQITVNDLPIGRSVDETLRLLQAIQYVEKHGEVCPAGWTPGAKTMVADPDKSMDYFSTVDAGPEGAKEFSMKPLTVKSKADYEKLMASGKPLVMDFYAPWCGKCRQIGPFVDELVDKYPSVTFAKFDTSSEALQEFAGELGVKALPAFRFFKGGDCVVDEVVGYKKRPLEEAVKMLAGK